MMKRTAALAMIVTAVSALAACDNSKSVAQVSRNTGAEPLRDSAAQAQQKADARIASARGDVRDEQQRDLADAAAIEEQRLADAQAEGEYQVALARCEGLSGATQKSCKDQADADFGVAKAAAKQGRASADPKP